MDQTISSQQPLFEDVGSITIKFTQSELEKACIGLCTVSGRPFSLMDDPGFQRIVAPIKCALEKKHKKKITISSSSIKNSITSEANLIRQKISEEIKNKLVSLKIDAATRLERSFLGINIQFIQDGKIVLRTLGLQELKDKHTGNFETCVIHNEMEIFIFQKFRFILNTD